MYCHNNADFAAGKRPGIGASSENGRKLPVLEHSQLRSLQVDMPDRKTAFVSRAHFGKAILTTTWGRLINMWALFKPSY